MPSQKTRYTNKKTKKKSILIFLLKGVALHFQHNCLYTKYNIVIFILPFLKLHGLGFRIENSYDTYILDLRIDNLYKSYMLDKMRIMQVILDVAIYMLRPFKQPLLWSTKP